MKVKRKNDPATRLWVIKQIRAAMRAMMKILLGETKAILEDLATSVHARLDRVDAQLRDHAEAHNESVAEINAHLATINMLKANVAILGRTVNTLVANANAALTEDNQLDAFRLWDVDGTVNPLEVDVEKLLAESTVPDKDSDGDNVPESLKTLLSSIFGDAGFDVQSITKLGNLTDGAAEYDGWMAARSLEDLCYPGNCVGCDYERARRVEAENAAAAGQADDLGNSESIPVDDSSFPADDASESTQDTPAPDVADVIAPVDETLPRAPHRRRVIKKSGDTKD